MTSAPKGDKAYVFDSYALLAFLKNEPGAAFVQDVIARISKGRAKGYVSAVNVAELFYILSRRKSEEEAMTFLRSLSSWKIQTVAADEELAVLAGRVKAGHSVSLADAFCVAVAQLKGAIVITGDPEFKSIKDIEISWLPKKESK